MKQRFLCLGIETSCDETAASVVQNGKKILSDIVLSQVNLHRIYGGVVPEIACRAHIESILPVIDRALKTARIKLKDIDVIAVSFTPGLIGALLVGVSAAKALSFTLNKPLIGINHIEAHLYACHFNHTRIKYPAIGLVASGGHTSIYLVKSPIKYTKIGATVDDAAGEAFDKVANILELDYPGGPAIEKSARKGRPEQVFFTRTYLTSPYDFSFSGIKTAVLYYARGQNASKTSPLKKHINIPDVAAGFQEAVIDTLVNRVISASKNKGLNSVILGGGVACNRRLRQKLLDTTRQNKIRLYIPPPRLCTDNAAMIAGMAYPEWKQNGLRRLQRAQLYLDARPRL